MQPHGAQWKPNPQPLRTKVMGAAAGCGRTDAIGEACAPSENDDASTPQARTNDNLLNMDKTPLLAACLDHRALLLEMEALADESYQGATPSPLGFLCGWLILGSALEHARLDARNTSGHDE